MRRATVLERVDGPAGVQKLRVAFWYPVPAANRAMLANLHATSAIRTLEAGELDLLRNGEVYELVEVIDIPEGATANAMRLEVEAQWEAHRRRARAKAEERFAFYGRYWDGESWKPPTFPVAEPTPTPPWAGGGA